MVKVVESPTRLNPPRLLDPIITTLVKYYQIPECQRPLDADAGSGGAQSDHLCVKFTPLNVINNQPARKKRVVKVRPLPKSGHKQLEEGLSEETWDLVTSVETAHEKALAFQSISLEAVNKFFPEKEVTFTSDDQPWINLRIKTEKRKRKRIYSKHRKSIAWETQKNLVCKLIKKAKPFFVIKKSV